MRRVVVTGGAGFIGSALCRHLVGLGDTVVLNIDKLTYAGNLASVRSIDQSPHYRFARADICDREAMDTLLAEFRPDAIMHLAAESHVDRSIAGSRAFIETNILGTFTLLEAARQQWQSLSGAAREAFRFLHVSTDEVYGSLGDSGLFTEETPYDPSSPYSASKAAADHLVAAWARTYGFPGIISNCSNNYGPFHFPEKLIPLAILNALHGKPIPVYGTGLNVRDWLYVDDHVAALDLIVRHGRVGETYNVGGRNERTNLDVVRTICTALDEFAPTGAPHDRLITFVTDRPGHDQRYAIDATKLEAELSWRAKDSFDSGIAKTVRWFLDNESWWRPLRERVYAANGWGFSQPLRRHRRADMRIAVTGRDGQVVRALVKLAALQPGVVILPLGRPAFDLAEPDGMAAALAATAPDIVVNAAAFTAVDKAEEEPDLAMQVNGVGAGAVAAAARELDVPVVQISTDYVFNGTKQLPYVETDPVGPINAYGRSKLAGEHAVAVANANHAILRTAWVYGTAGRNFLRTMLKLAETRAEINVVADQLGTPTYASDIARAVLTVCTNLTERPDDVTLRGTFHLTNAGSTSWAGFATAIFDEARQRGWPHATVRPIPTADYPTPARRPNNSRLDCTKLGNVHAVALSDWREALARCCDALEKDSAQ